MLLDANLLLYAVDESSPFHQAARGWLTTQLNGDRRVGLPWISLAAFLRISTNPRASDDPLAPDEAWSFVQEWLANEVVWIPAPTDRHAQILGALVKNYQLRGNLITDAQLAALAVEHGLVLCSGDTDFARFMEIRWHNPLASGVGAGGAPSGNI